MRNTRWLSAAALALVTTMTCSDPTEPESQCPTIGSVTATVITGSSVVFDWSPACGVAFLLVEDDASDQWGISTPDFSAAATEAANTIVPPITYGVAPSGTVQNPSPATLIAGRTYELILWKVLPQGASPQCQQRLNNACLLTVKAFQR